MLAPSICTRTTRPHRDDYLCSTVVARIVQTHTQQLYLCERRERWDIIYRTCQAEGVKMKWFRTRTSTRPSSRSVSSVTALLLRPPTLSLPLLHPLLLSPHPHSHSPSNRPPTPQPPHLSQSRMVIHLGRLVKAKFY
jgi:hypothetical protein